MPRRISRLRWGNLEAHARISIVVGLTYQVAALIVFRDVVWAIPSLLAGTSVINGDELVPFFNPSSQLFEQARGDFSELTNGFEFRVRYSFLTTWVRHYKVLPFAILFLLPTIVWGAYLTTAWFISRVFTSLSKVSIYAGASFPTALIYLIVIYAKITHFYTLVAGLCMMTISALTMLYALIFREEKWRSRMAFSCVVALLNPAVHYLILFALFLSLTITTLVVGEFSKWIRERGPSRLWNAHARRRVTRIRSLSFHDLTEAGQRWSETTLGRCSTAIVLFVLISLVPYALFVKFIALRGVENLTETVPGDYYFIKDASVSLVHILAWDLAGIMDKIQFGDYLAKTPRVPNILYMFLAMSPIMVPAIRRSLFSTRAHRQLLGVIYVNVAFAVWATVGYANPSWFPTFHRSLAATTRALYATDSTVGDLTLTISSTIVQILRFPHRFQLILFMLGPVLMSLPVIWIIEQLHIRAVARRARDQADQAKEIGTATRIAMAIAVGSVFFVPFFSNEPYREVYGSGNFNHFATPYPVGDLQDIKTTVTALPPGKTVVFPPAETSKLIIDSNGRPHKFIDKFYIYYLDQPSFYYGLTGDVSNKFEFFLILRGIYYRQDWWINIARDIGLEYIVLNKQIEDNRGVGAEYLPEIEKYLRDQIEELPKYIEFVTENESFALYRLNNTVSDDREILLFDTSWNEFLDTVFARLDLSSCYDFQYLSNYDPPPAGTGVVHLLASDHEAAALDLWAAENEASFFRPSSKIFAFNPDIISSSYYLSPMFRLFLFFSDTKWNRNQMITPGIFGTLHGSFIGVPRPTRFTVGTVAPVDDRYRILLRAASPANQLEVTAPSLDFSRSFELRSPDDALKIFGSDVIYEADRVATDISSMTVSELEGRVPEELVPVNFRYAYHDLGTVDATAGTHTFVFDKLDSNPMLVEGVVLIPEQTYQQLGIPEGVHLAESVEELDCSDTSPVRRVSRNAYLDPAANGPHADLTNEQLFELLGLEDLAPPEPDGIGGQWIHLASTFVIVAGCMLVIRWRTRLPIEIPAVTNRAGRTSDHSVAHSQPGQPRTAALQLPGAGWHGSYDTEPAPPAANSDGLAHSIRECGEAVAWLRFHADQFLLDQNHQLPKDFELVADSWALTDPNSLIAEMDEGDSERARAMSALFLACADAGHTPRDIDSWVVTCKESLPKVDRRHRTSVLALLLGALSAQHQMQPIPVREIVRVRNWLDDHVRIAFHDDEANIDPVDSYHSIHEQLLELQLIAMIETWLRVNCGFGIGAYAVENLTHYLNWFEHHWTRCWVADPEPGSRPAYAYSTASGINWEIGPTDNELFGPTAEWLNMLRWTAWSIPGEMRLQVATHTARCRVAAHNPALPPT